jgi:hypothetical protein
MHNGPSSAVMIARGAQRGTIDEGRPAQRVDRASA